MKFRLTKTLARNFSATAGEPSNAKETESLAIEQLQISVRAPEQESPKSFAICFEIQAKALVSGGESLAIDCEYWAFFESEQPLNKEQINGPFTRINAPAIAFPYLRSFITNYLVNAGYPALHLPTVNFLELAKKH